MANRVFLGNIRGATGLTGATGATGQAGANGLTPYVQNGTWWIGTTDTGVTAKGNEWLYGEVVPTSQGVNGDLYLNTATEDVYKKVSGIWVLITNIKGEQGEKGEKGDKGDTALTFAIGTVTSGDTASVTNVGTGQDIVLDFTLPKGDKGEVTQSIIEVGGEIVDKVEFKSDPQTQIDKKLDSKLGVENAGKLLIVDEAGEISVAETTSTIDESDKVPTSHAVFNYVNSMIISALNTEV